MEVKRYTKVLLWDQNKWYYLIIKLIKQYTKVLVWDQNKWYYLIIDFPYYVIH